MESLAATFSPAQQAYTEYGKLAGSIKDNAAGLKQAAQQFESIFVGMWLQSAREADKVFAEDSPFASSEMEMHQQMLDRQLAIHLSTSGGIGLAPIIVRQLGGEPDPPPMPTTEPLRHPPQRPVNANAVTQMGGRHQAFASPTEFLASIKPKIAALAAAAGLPADAIIGQAALETGWGGAVPADASGNSSHNLFGVKATEWSGPTVEIHSKEYEFGRWIDKRSAFRAYPDWEAGIADYVAKIKESPRYAAAVDAVSDPVQYLRGIQQAGYATDPRYADKVLSVMNRIERLGY